MAGRHHPLAARRGTDVEICNVIDDHSRYLVASTCRTTYKSVDVVDTFTHAYTRYGLPASILTDNGAVFAGAPRGGRVALEKQADHLGIRVIHSRPYHPQTCGKVERFHQTLKQRLRALDPAADLDHLQTQLDTFAHLYNTERPHRAVGRRTPAEAYHARPKAGPAPGGLDPTHHRIRHDRIDTNGVVTLRHDSRLHHIGIGRAHAGTPVTLLVAELHVRVITHDGELLRELTLDPTRDYQPQSRAPRPPT